MKILNKLNLSIILFLFTSRIFACGEIPPAEVELSGNKNRQGPIVLIVHGLNLKPSKMESLKHIVEKSGLSNALITLKGHQSVDDQAWKSVTAKDWQNQMRSIANWLNRCQLKWIGLSQSTGSVLLFWMEQQKLTSEALAHFSFAPAIFTRYSLYPLHLAAKIFPSYGISSRNHKDYRVHDETTLTAYSALYETAQSLDTENFPSFKNRVLVFMSENDELVDFKKTKKWIEDHDGSIISYLPGPEKREVIHHLLIDPEVAGTSNFRHIEAQILNRLYQFK
ncbi:MAG: hypothetical protein Fur0010_14740 [Bdellovibrio sp.]